MADKLTTFIGKVIGTKGQGLEGLWSTVYVYEPTIERVQLARGNLYVLIDIPQEYAALGKEVIETLRENYYHDLEGNPLHSLEGALTHVNQKLEDFNRRLVTERQESMKRLHITCAVLAGSDLHLAQIGDAQTYLIRRGRLHRVGNIHPDAPGRTQSFGNIASGALEVGDIFALATKHIFEVIPLNKFREIVTSCYPSVAAARITEHLSQAARLEGACALIVEANREQGLGVHPRQQEEPRASGDALPEASFPAEDEPDEPVTAPDEEQPVVADISAPRRVRSVSQQARSGQGNIAQKIVRAVKDYFGMIGRLVRGEEDPARLAPLFLFLAGIIVLIVVAQAFLRAPHTENPVVQTNQALDEAVESYQSGVEYLRTNDATNARDAFLIAQSKAKEAQVLGIQADEATELLAKIQNELDDMDGVTRISASALYDFNDETLGTVQLTALGIVGDSAYALDAGQQKLYAVNRQNAALTEVASGFFADARASRLTVTDGLVYIYADGTPNRVGIFDPGTGMFGEVSIMLANETWQNADAFVGWTDSADQSRLYLLDRTENALWRYKPSGVKFMSPENYFADQEINLNDVVDIAIDGDVYLVLRNCQVALYEQAVLKVDYAFTGMTQPSCEAASLTTVTAGSALYLLDRLNQRVLIFDKESGQLRKMYAVDQGWEQLGSIAVDESQGTGYVLSDNIIYSFPLYVRRFVSRYTKRLRVPGHEAAVVLEGA